MQKNREITTFPKKKKDLGKMQSDEKTVFPDYEKNLIFFAGGLILFGIYLPFLWFCNLKPFEVRLPRTW